MIINKKTLEYFEIPPCEIARKFLEKFPEGLDISPIWGVNAGEFWELLEDITAEYLKTQLG